MSEETSPGGLSLPRDVAQRIESDPSLLSEHMPGPVVDRRTDQQKVADRQLFDVTNDPQTGVTHIGMPGTVPSVVLDDREVSLAEAVATARALDNEIRGRHHAHGYTGPNLETHMDGARCELAFCKLSRYQLHWNAVICVPDLRVIEADVGRYGVRGTTYANGALLLHDSDPDDQEYVLVIDRHPEYRFPGWILGRDGKQSKFWGDPHSTGRPCFWVPQSDLVPWDRRLA